MAKYKTEISAIGNTLFFFLICFLLCIASNSVLAQSCTLPSNVTVGLTASNMIFSWDAGSTNATYTLQLRPSLGGEWENFETMDTSLSLSAYTTCTLYDYRVRAQCGNIPTAFTSLAQILSPCQACNTSGYCLFDNIDNDFEWIDIVTINGLTYNSGKDINGYGEHLGKTQFSAVQGDIAEIKLKPGFLGSTVSKEFYSAWIDYNQDGQFEADENIFSIDSLITDQYEHSFIIPNTALIGQTRLRIILAFNRQPRSCDFNDFVFGEIEDYCIEIIQKTSPCDVNLTIQADNITDNSMSLSWEDNDIAIGYDLRYKSEGTPWQSLISFSNSSTISGLVPCTTYEFQNRLVCGEDTSSYGPSVFYETLCSTSTVDVSPDVHFDIFPNPTDAYLMITSTQIINSVDVISPKGERLLGANMSSQQYNLNLAQLENGLYILKIFTDRGFYTRKILKL